MFWVGLATLIMIISGSGDDSRDLRTRWEAMREAIIEAVKDPERAQKAVRTVRATESVFWQHRARLELVGKCIEKADRSYAATEADYLACEKDLAAGWARTSGDIIDAEKAIRAALKEDEFRTIQARSNGEKR